jgi:hypothetical protein
LLFHRVFIFQISTFLSNKLVVLGAFDESMAQPTSRLTKVASVDVAHPFEGIVVATKSCASSK